MPVLVKWFKIHRLFPKMEMTSTSSQNIFNPFLGSFFVLLGWIHLAKVQIYTYWLVSSLWNDNCNRNELIDLYTKTLKYNLLTISSLLRLQSFNGDVTNKYLV